MILMVNNPKIMGSYVNNRLQNAVGWATTAILILLTVMLLGTPLLPMIRRLFA
jgi:Mn2+/Fe2+ NRAMP family transporter